MNFTPHEAPPVREVRALAFFLLVNLGLNLEKNV